MLKGRSVCFERRDYMDELELMVMLQLITDMTDRQIQAAPEYIRIAAAEAHDYIIKSRDKPGDDPGKI